MTSSEPSDQVPGLLPTEGSSASNNFVRATLDAVKALLSIEGREGSFGGVLETMHRTFGFDRALVLEDRDENLHCIAAWPGDAIGRRRRSRRAMAANTKPKSKG